MENEEQKLSREELERKLAQLTENINSKELDLTRLNDTLEDKDEELRILVKKYDVKERELRDMEEKWERAATQKGFNDSLIKGQKEEIASLTEKIKVLNDKHDILVERDNMYSKDIEGYARRNKEEREQYNIGLGLSISSLVLSIALLLYQVFCPSTIPEKISIHFNENEHLWFGGYLVFRASVIGILLFMAYLSISFVRSFLAQLSHLNEKMNGVRLIDMLVGKLEKKPSIQDSNERILFEKAILEKQASLLNKHMAELITVKPSAFEKGNANKFNMDVIRELLTVIKGQQ